MNIPSGLYALCEKRRRARYTAIEAAEDRLREARQAAESVRGAAFDPAGAGQGRGRGDGLERAAIRVAEAEDALQQALAWDDLFMRLDRIYPDDTRESMVSRLLFDRGMTQAAVCQALHLRRITVRRHQDNYMINLALLAVQAGLARVEGEDGQS